MPATQQVDRFGPIRDAALADVRAVCLKLLPAGRDARNHWRAPVPWRDDADPSLVVYYNSGRWLDLGQAEKGTLFELVMKIDGCDLMTARDTLAEIVGLGGAAPVARKRRKVLKCPDCAHSWQRYPNERACTVVTLDDEPVRTQLARHPGSACGPMGNMFAARVQA